MYFNLSSLVDRPSCREDFKFLHILYPATVYPMQITNPQMKTTKLAIKNQISRLPYRISKFNVSRTTRKTAIMPSNIQMFWSLGAANEIFVVSRSMRSRILNADSNKAFENVSISNDTKKISVVASPKDVGVQRWPMTLSVAARNNWTVVKRPYIFRLGETCIHCRIKATAQITAKAPNRVVKRYE